MHFDYRIIKKANGAWWLLPSRSAATRMPIHPPTEDRAHALATSYTLNHLNELMRAKRPIEPWAPYMPKMDIRIRLTESQLLKIELYQMLQHAGLNKRELAAILGRRDSTVCRLTSIVNNSRSITLKRVIDTLTQWLNNQVP